MGDRRTWFISFSICCSIAERICATCPLSERKARLKALLAKSKASDNIRYVDHLSGAGDAVLQSACRMHLEGIISKRLSAPYRSGRTGDLDQIQMPRRP